jgi:hypothetical protein
VLPEKLRGSAKSRQGFVEVPDAPQEGCFHKLRFCDTDFRANVHIVNAFKTLRRLVKPVRRSTATGLAQVSLLAVGFLSWDIRDTVSPRS